MTFTNDIVKDVDFIREMCSLIRAARAEVGIPNIQPLMSVTFYKELGEFDWLLFNQYADIIAKDCNIKYVEWEIIFDDDYNKFNIIKEASLNFREAGKVLGKQTQEVGKAIREGNYTIKDGGVEVNGIFLDESLVQVKVYVDNEANLKKDYHVTRVGDQSFIVLDTLIYSGLYLKRLSQEVIKLINKARKDHGCEVGDSVNVVVSAPEEYRAALEENFETVSKYAKCNLRFEPSTTLSIKSMETI